MKYDCLGVIDGTHVWVNVPRLMHPDFEVEKIGQLKMYLDVILTWNSHTY